MATRKTLTVSLTPELEEFMASRVDSGNFVSASEVVREGLRLLEERKARREAELDRLRRDIRVRLEQARAGEPVDGEEVFEELKRRGASPNWDVAPPPGSGGRGAPLLARVLLPGGLPPGH